MALIKCIECGNEVSDQAKKCPHCGVVNKKNSGKNKKVIIIVLISVIAIIGIFAGVIGAAKNEKDKKNSIYKYEWMEVQLANTIIEYAEEYFKNSSSVRLVNLGEVELFKGYDNGQYEISKVYVELSSTNSFGAHVDEYYLIDRNIQVPEENHLDYTAGYIENITYNEFTWHWLNGDDIHYDDYDNRSILYCFYDDEDPSVAYSSNASSEEYIYAMEKVDDILDIGKYETISVYVDDSHVKTINEMIEKYWARKGL